jgi:AraC-like DNA-binding protein
MEQTVALVTLVDLLFRFSALGLLIALVLFNWPRLSRLERLLSVSLATSLAFFLLLTQPLPEWRFNPLRNLFLAGTELLPLVLCACAWYLIKQRVPHWLTTYEALQTLLAQGIYREPELTIGLLAERLDIPTHQLRTLINQQLGCKNFSHFINQYRLAYAAEQLRDLAHARTAILSIAYDAGFNSIGPFNRVFKQAYALTPGDYRRQHLSAVQSSSKDCTGS